MAGGNDEDLYEESARGKPKRYRRTSVQSIESQSWPRVGAAYEPRPLTITAVQVVRPQRRPLHMARKRITPHTERVPRHVVCRPLTTTTQFTRGRGTRAEALDAPRRSPWRTAFTTNYGVLVSIDGESAISANPYIIGISYTVYGRKQTRTTSNTKNVSGMSPGLHRSLLKQHFPELQKHLRCLLGPLASRPVCAASPSIPTPEELPCHRCRRYTACRRCLPALLVDHPCSPT